MLHYGCLITYVALQSRDWLEFSNWLLLKGDTRSDMETFKSLKVAPINHLEFRISISIMWTYYLKSWCPSFTKLCFDVLDTILKAIKVILFNTEVINFFDKYGPNKPWFCMILWFICHKSHKSDRKKLKKIYMLNN